MGTIKDISQRGGGGGGGGWGAVMRCEAKVSAVRGQLSWTEDGGLVV